MTIPLIYQNDSVNNFYNDYVPRSEQIWIKPNDIISRYCHISKSLYNDANFIVRDEYIHNNRYVPYEELYYIMKDNENYLLLPIETAQQTLRVLERNWKGYFASQEDWNIHPEKYLGKPRIPGYLEKGGEFILYFTSQQVWIIPGKNSNNNRIRFPKMLDVLNYKFPIRTRLKDVTIKEVRIIPKGIGYIIDLVYYRKVRKLNLYKDRIIGLDLGIRNVVAIGNNIGEKPIIIKGGVLRSINQFYNKTRARIQSVYDRRISTLKKQWLTRLNVCKEEKDKIRKDIREIVFGHSITNLTGKRNKKVKDVMHKYSRWIIDYCIRYGIGTIVIGYNPEWKQNIKLGKMNNQNFASIPFYTLKEMIIYKAEEVGINVVEQEESHTSKCSFIDGESIEHHEIYIGRRISRGLFRSAKGMIINADVQGAYNIIKKAFPKAFQKLRADEIEDVGLHPLRINPLGVSRSINQINLINDEY